MDALALLRRLSDCLIDDGGYPRFTVAHGRDFDAAALAVCEALFPDEYPPAPDHPHRAHKFLSAYPDSFAA